MTDLTTLTDPEFAELDAAVTAERSRRATLAAVPQQIADLNRAYLGSEGVEQGQPWRQPTGAHDAYPKDWVTEHKDKTWTSLMDGNVWEPPTGWREVVADGQGYPEYVQPTGGHDAYNTGDKVSFDGRCFESNRDANVWSPADLPSAWDEVPCQ